MRNTAALCGFTFLSADSRKEPPLRTQVDDRRGHRLRTSHVVTCMCILISSCICKGACFAQADIHFISQECTAKSFLCLFVLVLI